jgi:hypothetical protein
MGGLGNQMLQYATALSISKQLNYQFILDVSYFALDTKIGNTHREFELGVFQQNDKQIRSFFSIPIINKMVMKLPGAKKLLLPLVGISYLTDVDDLLSLKKKHMRPLIYLDGYWVKYLYFNSIRNEISTIFNFSKQITGVNTEIAKSMKCGNSVALHVRRTDYMLANSSHYVLDVGYYKEAIRSISKDVSDPVFYFFGDDHDWIRANFYIDDINCILVDNNEGKNGYLDMALMTQAKHIVISNSTFSWWAAYLNDNGGIKIAPAKWFLPGKNSYFVYDDFIPVGWKRV